MLVYLKTLVHLMENKGERRKKMKRSRLLLWIICVILSCNIAVSSAYSGGKININTCSKRRLEKISGIGRQTAESIISYRRAIGHFDTIDELKEVPGIGEVRFNKLKQILTVDWR